MAACSAIALGRALSTRTCALTAPKVAQSTQPQAISISASAAVFVFSTPPTTLSTPHFKPSSLSLATLAMSGFASTYSSSSMAGVHPERLPNIRTSVSLLLLSFFPIALHAHLLCRTRFLRPPTPSSARSPSRSSLSSGPTIPTIATPSTLQAVSGTASGLARARKLGRARTLLAVHSSDTTGCTTRYGPHHLS
jgi:hypothetical protein